MEYHYLAVKVLSAINADGSKEYSYGIIEAETGRNVSSINSNKYLKNVQKYILCTTTLETWRMLEKFSTDPKAIEYYEKQYSKELLK